MGLPCFLPFHLPRGDKETLIQPERYLRRNLSNYSWGHHRQWDRRSVCVRSIGIKVRQGTECIGENSTRRIVRRREISSRHIRHHLPDESLLRLPNDRIQSRSSTRR